jgi:DNA (cytosine-5)-methyltransferase 1
MLKVLDLFSGIGGFSLGLERTGGFQTVAFCEIEPFARRVLAKHWPGVPIHQDVRKLKGSDVGTVDVVCGGYPCQPFSLAGKRAGQEDDRHLWPEMRRLVDELRPSWVIGENVAGHISMGLDDVLSDLGALGYAWRPFVIPAVSVGAPHRRERVWIVANRDSGQCVKQNDEIRAGRHAVGSSGEAMANAPELHGNGGDIHAGSTGEGLREGRAVREPRGGGEDVSHSYGSRLQAPWPQPHGANWFNGGGVPAADSWWSVEPDVGRVAHGVPSRVDRLRGLGNAVVPQIPEIIGRAILTAEAAHAA